MAATPLRWGRYRSPLGLLWLCEDTDGPRRVSFSPPATEGSLAPDSCTRIRAWLERYFAGQPDSFPYPAGLPATGRERAVWQLLSEIPYGATTTYGAIARRVGLTPRVVGRLVGRNPLAILIPCHRVVGSGGRLIGFGGGLHRKRWLLDHETRAMFALGLEGRRQAEVALS